MNPAKFRTMIAGGAPDWDVADITIDFLYAGIGDKLFEKIDTKLVDTEPHQPAIRQRIRHRLHRLVVQSRLQHQGLCTRRAAANLGRSVRPEALPRQAHAGDNVVSSLEIALLADGVAPDKLYPLDVERALKKLDTIKSDTIFWGTNSQSQQLFVDGEVGLGMILNGRAYDAAKKGAPIGISWEQNIQSVDYLAVPRGSRNRDAAMLLIDTMTQPDNQAKLANLIAYAPTNPAAFKSIDKRSNPGCRRRRPTSARASSSTPRSGATTSRPLQERWSAWKLA